MDSFTAPDTDLCGDCGLDPCNCHAEVERRLCQRQAPKGLAANLPDRAPLVSRAPDTERASSPILPPRTGVPVGGIQQSLGLALDGYADLRAELERNVPALAARLELIFIHVTAARDDLAFMRGNISQGSRPS